jgi:hypothetical protein
VTTDGPRHVPTKTIKKAFEADNAPPFSEWGDEWEMLEVLTSKFDELCLQRASL